MNKNSEDLVSAARPSREQIALRAELLWKAQGSPTGRDEQIWLEAERQLFDEARELITQPAEKLSQEEIRTPQAPASDSAEQMSPKRTGSSSTKRRSSSGR